jgi:hypothetical protein
MAERFDQGSSQPPTSPKWQTWLSPPRGQTYRTILPWIAQETQYCSLRYILGTVYSANTEASEISPGTHDQSAKMRNQGRCQAGSRGIVVGGGRFSKTRTDGCRLDHVADGEPLDGLILGGASRAVGAPDGLDVAAACAMSVSKLANERQRTVIMLTLLVAAVVLSLLDHFVGVLSSLILKRLCGRRTADFRISAGPRKPESLRYRPTIPHAPDFSTCRAI